jgi:hypothetical protein
MIQEIIRDMVAGVPAMLIMMMIIPAEVILDKEEPVINK